MKKVFKFFIPCLCAILMSASSCEERIDDSNDEVGTFTDGFSVVVNTKFIDDGCEVLLEMDENGEKVMLMPIELDDQFKIDGVELLITFSASRIMQSTCQMGRPIVINTVKLVD